MNHALLSKLAYHYTDTVRLPWIIESGELRPVAEEIAEQQQAQAANSRKPQSGLPSKASLRIDGEEAVQTFDRDPCGAWTVICENCSSQYEARMKFSLVSKEMLTCIECRHKQKLSVNAAIPPWDA